MRIAALNASYMGARALDAYRFAQRILRIVHRAGRARLRPNRWVRLTPVIPTVRRMHLERIDAAHKAVESTWESRYPSLLFLAPVGGPHV